MKQQSYKRSAQAPVGLEALWQWHMQPGAFERLAPAWQHLIPEEMPHPLETGSEISFLIKAGPFRKRWRARLELVEAPHQFVDTQLEGPFHSWRHEHVMTPFGSDKSILTDAIQYALPAGLGRLPWIRRRAAAEIERLFAFRHERMLADLERFGGRQPGRGKTVLISGSSGLIGSRLVPFLKTLGYTVRGLSRNPKDGDTYRWNPSAGEVDPQALEGVDAVIHLAGENIASGLWTKKRRERILRSRVQGTRTLVEAMGRLSRKPEVFVSASGVNYYAFGSDAHEEEGEPGDGFLAEVCRRWEEEAVRARKHGIRTVCIRTGVVLDPRGGALAKMLPAFRMGLGGPIGSGEQGFPWIGMDDLLDIYERGVRDDQIAGPVNAVHPQLLSQGDFSRTLGTVLHRPARLRVPAWVIGAFLGQMGKETLLADLRVLPGVLTRHGHAFRHESLSAELAFMLGRKASRS